ncbi:PEP-CTERM sorting domain-containing protein [Thiobacillus sp.]|uniref:PEP-CTERM sorting domain-containing protein n=1 Tax=Thiobacillus sp. TaxID=924 RepID=UPI0025EA6859|nr:PEP-CTERM sorting domain-containing protein [Thiobacillus sp.]
MKHITKTLAGIALGCCMASSVAQAASIQSLTIEEISTASGGLGTSALAGGGGWGNWQDQFGNTTAAPAYFTSNGIDSSIKMGSTQASGSISQTIVWSGKLGNINTLNGAPSGSISGGVMNLNFAGLVTEYFAPTNLAFNISPDSGSLITHVAIIDASRYYYTADWTHVANNDVINTSSNTIHSGFNGSTSIIHFEGIATLAPVPEAETYAMMLSGLGLVGLMAYRRRKLI